MAPATDGGLVSGLGSASVLLQVQLALGFALSFLGVAAAANPALGKQLASTSWEATLRAAAKALSPAPLLVAFALVQARGAVPDILTSVGLLVSGTAVVLGAFLAVLGPIMAAGTPVADEEPPAPPRFSRASRVLGSCCAFGQALLILGALPAGTQLMCASLFIRLALAAQLLAALAKALALRPGGLAGALADAEHVTGLAPLFGAMALLDQAAWGPGGAATLPLQPALYAALQVGLVLVVRLFLGGQVENGTSRPEFDLRFSSEHDGPSPTQQLETARGANVAMLYLSMALGVGKVLAGVYTVGITGSALTIQWGDVLTAASSKFLALIVGVYVAEYALAHLAGCPEEHEGTNGAAPTNGMEVPELVGGDSCGALTTMDYLKAIVAPAHVLLLAMLAARMALGTDTGVSAVAVAPFRYGFVLVAAAVWVQVLSLMVFAATHCDEPSMPEPPFDVTGTIQWESKGAITRKLGEWCRSATLALLLGGLLLGCIGLGPLSLIIGGPCTLLLLYYLSPPKARETAEAMGKVLVSACVACLGTWFAGLEEFLEKRRQAREAAAAQRAAAVGEELEAEAAQKGGGKAAAQKGGKASAAEKATSSKQPPTSGEKKAMEPQPQPKKKEGGGGGGKKRGKK